MRLTIEGEMREFMPIKEFRVRHGLPPEFGVALFEPKDYTGLGRIDSAGAQLNGVRQAVLDAIPRQMPLQSWMAFLPQLTGLFQQKLYDINYYVGLKDVEVEFAVAGFGDVCQALLYAMLRARAGSTPLPDFEQIYGEWMDNSARTYGEAYEHTHEGQVWRVRLVAHAYGRAGLIVDTGRETHYVYDPALGCPAEGFMAALLNDVAGRMIAATVL
jgi:hypothetical protein